MSPVSFLERLERRAKSFIEMILPSNKIAKDRDNQDQKSRDNNISRLPQTTMVIKESEGNIKSRMKTNITSGFLLLKKLLKNDKQNQLILKALQTFSAFRILGVAPKEEPSAYSKALHTALARL